MVLIERLLPRKEELAQEQWSFLFICCFEKKKKEEEKLYIMVFHYFCFYYTTVFYCEDEDNGFQPFYNKFVHTTKCDATAPANAAAPVPIK